MRSIFGQNTSALLTFALTAVLVIAIVGGISSYVEKYLTTTVSQWVAHDLRMLLYQRIQRLSLAEHGKSRSAIWSCGSPRISTQCRTSSIPRCSASSSPS